MKKKAIFFIEAPFQLLSAYEAISQYLIVDYSIIIRLSGRAESDRQLSLLMEMLFKQDEKVKFILINVNSRTIIDYIKMFYYSIYMSIFQKKYKYIFIGNMESGFLSLLMKFIYKNKIILLDDGIKSITFQNNFNEKSYYNLYTMLDNLKKIRNQIIVHNKFLKLRKLISNVEHTNDVLFVGSKLSEVGAVSEQYYIEYLKKIINYYNGSKIIYIPHRGENTDKLTKISMLKNITVQGLDYPIEMYPIFTKKLPKNIASFYSAALISLSKLYPETQTKSFFLNKPSLYRKEIHEAYKYIENYMEVVDLND